MFSFILGSLFDNEMKIVSLYFFNSSKLSESTGPIIILAPASIISFIALFNCSLFFDPESLGIITILSSPISSKQAELKEARNFLNIYNHLKKEPIDQS